MNAPPAFVFPPPSGPYRIGTVTRHWVDHGRREVLSSRPSDRRELMVQLWYPAHDVPSAPRAPYLPDAEGVAPALADFLGVPPSTLEPLARVTTNAVEGAPIADDGTVFPVLILLVGIKGSYRQIQTFQVEELVSHGYVVAAIDQPYSVAMVVYPDGHRIAYDDRWAPPRSAFMDAHIPYLARDVSFTIDELCALAHAEPNQHPDRTTRPRACRTRRSFVRCGHRRRGLPGRFARAGRVAGGGVHARRCRPRRLGAAGHVHHPSERQHAPRTSIRRRVDRERHRRDPGHDASRVRPPARRRLFRPDPAQLPPRHDRRPVPLVVGRVAWSHRSARWRPHPSNHQRRFGRVLRSRAPTRARADCSTDSPSTSPKCSSNPVR